MVRCQRQKISDKQVKWAQCVLKKSRSFATKGQVDGLPEVHYAKVFMEMYSKQSTPDYLETMVVRIGDIAIVGLPGEMFCEFGLEVRKKSPAKHTIIVGIANGDAGYFPTKKSFAQGGYEPSTGSTFYVKGTGEKIVVNVLRQLASLF